MGEGDSAVGIELHFRLFFFNILFRLKEYFKVQRKRLKLQPTITT